MLFSRGKSDDDTVVEVLASALRRDISFGVLRPDEKLKIEGLRQRYGGSNHSMRETLRTLVAEGMVEATNQRGFRVTSATIDDMRDILLMRVEIEKIGVARSLERGAVEWETDVVASHHRLARADDEVQANPDDLTALEWDEACRLFSTALMSACASERLIDTAARFHNQSRRFRLASLREGRIDFAARASRHEALKRAVLERATGTALQLLEESITADMV